ncbi:response regulator transcription factor [Streptomyces sp. NPDC057116]|uniref:response regulator transcription factor n=1 Tax=Streptomyces sp. NPDC057116 TaxID=3346023 RepID=UPI003633E40A
MGERDLSVLTARRTSLQMIPGGAAAPSAVRVYVLGADALARGGIRALLTGQPAVHVVGDGEPGPDAPAEITATRADVVLAHGAAPGPGPLPPHCRSLTVGGSEPGHGRLPATATAPQLASALVLAAAGYTVAPPGAARPTGPPAVSGVGPEQLTDRERQVLRLMADGLSNAEIAGSLTLSEHTVKTHVQNLLGKLRLRNRVHAVVYAFETGLRTPR